MCTQCNLARMHKHCANCTSMLKKSSIVILLTSNYTCYTDVIRYLVPPLYNQLCEKSNPLIEEPLKL